MKTALVLILSMFLAACTPTILPERVYESVDMATDQADLYKPTKFGIPIAPFTIVGTQKNNWSYNGTALEFNSSGTCDLSETIELNKLHLPYKRIRVTIAHSFDFITEIGTISSSSVIGFVALTQASGRLLVTGQTLVGEVQSFETKINDVKDMNLRLGIDTKCNLIGSTIPKSRWTIFGIWYEVLE